MEESYLKRKKKKRLLPIVGKAFIVLAFIVAIVAVGLCLHTHFTGNILSVFGYELNFVLSPFVFYGAILVIFLIILCSIISSIKRKKRERDESESLLAHKAREMAKEEVMVKYFDADDPFEYLE